MLVYDKLLLGRGAEARGGAAIAGELRSIVAACGLGREGTDLGCYAGLAEKNEIPHCQH